MTLGAVLVYLWEAMAHINSWEGRRIQSSSNDSWIEEKTFEMSSPSPGKGIFGPYPGWFEDQQACILNSWTSSEQQK